MRLFKGASFERFEDSPLCVDDVSEIFLSMKEKLVVAIVRDSLTSPPIFYRLPIEQRIGSDDGKGDCDGVNHGFLW
jgi:hypothetical protein